LSGYRRHATDDEQSSSGQITRLGLQPLADDGNFAIFAAICRALPNRAILLIKGLAVACEVSMTDLHQTPGIDALGRLFSAITAVIIAVAAVIAYEAHEASVANASVSHVVAR
jgi:hypothetical protein